MSIFRSYFSKNNTLISNNLTNNSQNPVTEISYGTTDRQLSRFIFDVDLTTLGERITQGLINPDNIVRHTLFMVNTISNAEEYIGKKSYDSDIQRASSFSLELFNINQDWDEGSGYDFIYNDTIPINAVEQASNWYSATTATAWIEPGGHITGTSAMIGTQGFDKGSENITIDVTDYINQRLLGVDYTGTTAYTGGSHGLGIKFAGYYEEIADAFRQAVAFHAKNTNTWYEPYIETEVDDTITDDRNYFYLDKDNDLYLYANIGGVQQDITVNGITIYNYDDTVITTISGDSILNVGKGIYKITLNFPSTTYPDAVLCRDVWDVTINGRDTTYNGEFYLIEETNYFSFNQSSQINFDNYHFYFWGINEKEKIKAGVIKKIKLTIKELYANQNNFVPLDIEYRLYTTVGDKYEIDVIPFTSVNRTNSGYEFNLDTSWLIPQDYYLQIRLKDGNYYENKQAISFTITSSGVPFITKEQEVANSLVQFPTGYMYNDILLYNKKTW